MKILSAWERTEVENTVLRTDETGSQIYPRGRETRVTIKTAN